MVVLLALFLCFVQGKGHPRTRQQLITGYESTICGLCSLQFLINQTTDGYIVKNSYLLPVVIYCGHIGWIILSRYRKLKNILLMPTQNYCMFN